MTYKLRNLQEGSKPANRIKNWEDATGSKASICHKVGCNAKATDEAHDQLVISNIHK